MFSRFKHIGVWTSDFLKNKSLHVGDIVTTFGKMFTRWLSGHITLGVVSVFCESVLKFSGGHPDIFTVRVVFTVVFRTFPVVNAVLCIA